MKTKKKSLQTKSINTIKLLNVRTVEQQKITNSTNQKTFATIEQNYRTHENSDTEFKRQSLKARFSFNKKTCVQRMQQNNLSPFSNDGRSFSPKYRKTPQKLLSVRDDKDVKFVLNLKQFEKKKTKTKANSARQTRQVNQNNNKKAITVINNKTFLTNNTNNNTPISHEIKKKAIGVGTKKKVAIKQEKKQKQQRARIQFQNEFLNMMNTRIKRQKITQISQQQLQCSIKRKPKLQIVVTSSQASSRQQRNTIKEQSSNNKQQIVKTMKLKIMQNINRDYPNLDHNQKKVMSAIIIIQRLWRQRKVKQFFQHYLTPRASLESCSFARDSLQKDMSSNISNRSTMNLLSSHMAYGKKLGQQQQTHSWETVPKKKILNNKNKNESQTKFQQNNFLIRQPSSQSVKNKLQSKIEQKESKLNEKVNKLLQESILSFQNENEKIVNDSSNHQLDRPSMIKFVECYREVKLNKRSNNKKSNSNKRSNNIFSMKESLSQKCLMQKYYQRIFADKPQKDKPKNYELFSLTSNHSNLGNQSLKLNQQSSIQLFKQISKHPDYVSPQKLLLKKKQNNDINCLQQEEQEQIWIRNQTTYSQQTDSDELIKQNQNVVILSPRKQAVIVSELIVSQSFNKKDNSKIEIKINELTPKKDHEVGRNKINQFQPNKVQNQPIQNSITQQQQLRISQNTNLSIIQPKQYSLKSIQYTADTIMAELMDQFFKQYLSFQQKQCLVKKRKQKHPKQQQKPKKPKLPGISITQKSISQYLNILIPYILTTDRQQISRSLQLFHHSTYQKCHRVQSSIYEIFQFGEQQQDEIYWNIISNQGFFLCLQKFWQQNVTLSKQNEKFTNFLDLTYKVYNRCITDAFSQIFNKLILQRVSYPWNSIRKSNKNRLVFENEMKAIVNQQEIEKIVQEVKQKLLKQCFCYSTTGGKLVKNQRKHNNNNSSNISKQLKQQSRAKQYQFGDNFCPQLQQQQLQQQLIIQKLSQQEFSKVMKIANQQFLQEEKQLIYCVDERYQLCGDLAESVLAELIMELEVQMGWSVRLKGQYCQGEEIQLTKSQQEIFLQTNQTLQTNYHP